MKKTLQISTQPTEQNVQMSNSMNDREDFFLKMGLAYGLGPSFSQYLNMSIIYDEKGIRFRSLSLGEF